MIPSRRALRLLVGWLGVACLASLWSGWAPVWTAYGILLAAALGVDAAVLVRRGCPAIERRVASSIAVGVWSPVSLSIAPWAPRGVARRTLPLELFDRVPASMDVRGLPRTLRLPGGDTDAEVRYQVFPRERGAHTFEVCDVRVGSPLGLLWRQLRRAAPCDVRVYPNFRAVTGYALLATDNRTSQLGIKKRPRRGQGLDFHQLREYREGDVLRQIDWRATARMARLISREYQDERDQQILFLLDCGRKMHARDGSLSHFDHALNAVLLLAHVALRQGDAVGVLTFSGERRWLAPRKGHAHLNALMNAVYDLESSPHASDYLVCAREVSARMRKRALVVWITNLRDEEHDELLAGIRLMAGRHLVLVASMQERALREAVEAPVHDFDGALRHASAQRYLLERRVGHQRASAQGVSLLDVEPDRLPVALVNRYLDIKSRRVL